MRRLFFYLLFCSISIVSAQQKQLCITVDDLPSVTYTINSNTLNEEITRKLTSTFQKHSIPAIGYINEQKLYTNNELDTNKVHLLEKWIVSNCDLGNHGYAHLDYNKVPQENYFNDILKGEKITRQLLSKHNKKLKYYRHPYLRTGSTKEKSDSLEAFLTKHNYTGAPVTIDNDDYLFAHAYHKAYVKEDYVKMGKIGKLYIDYMEEKLLFFENKSIEAFGVPITQTLLIHASLINAHYIKKLVKMYAAHDYVFVSQEVALQDPIYSTPITVYRTRGISWLFRWAISNGASEEIMDGDPQVPEELTN